MAQSEQRNQEPQTQNEEKVIAEEKAEDEENPSEVTATNDDKDRSRDYKFPSSMSANYPARIIFRVIKIDGVDLFEATGLKKLLLEEKDNNKESQPQSVADERTDKTEKDRIIGDSNKASTELFSYENNTGGEKIGSVTLPLMSPLRYQDVATYTGNSTSLGVIGGLTESGILGGNPFEGASNNAGQIGQAASALAAGAIARNAATGLGAAAGLIAGGKGLLSRLGGGAVGAAAAGAAFGGGSADVGIQAATRIASAPNYRSLFKEVALREFDFDFKLIAMNAEEARTIKNIVTMFRQELYPEKIPLGDTGLPIAYKYPNLFEIEVKNSKDKNPGFKFQRCFLRTVTTIFNESQRGMYEDGSFVEVTINLGFGEIVAVDKGKVREGY